MFTCRALFKGDSLSYHVGMNFSTTQSAFEKTRNGIYRKIEICDEKKSGGWWYKDCGGSNLNGEHWYGQTKEKFAMSWKGWTASKYPLKRAKMMIREKYAAEFADDD